MKESNVHLKTASKRFENFQIISIPYSCWLCTVSESSAFWKTTNCSTCPSKL